MFNIASMKTALVGAIGLRNSDDPAFANLISTLIDSDTGMYWNDYHPLITFENLYAIAPNFDGYNVTAYAAGTTYAINELVKVSGVVYRSVQGSNTGNNPATDDGTWWELPMNDWLTNKINASISKVLNKLFTNKKLTESTKTFLENVQLFEGAGSLADTITASGRFVGLQISPKKINNIQIVVDYIGLQFNQIQTGLTIYLFHSGNPTAITSQAITTAAANRFHWQAATGFTLNYVNYVNHIDSGGDFFIGYFEDDITGSAIKKRHQFADPPCGGCSESDWNLYNLWNKFFDVWPFEVASGNLNGTSLWDISKNGYSFTNNFGLNLSISVKSDVTDMLVSNKSAFTDALGYQFAFDMLNEFIYNPNSRLNREGDNAQLKTVLYELNNPNDEATLVKRLNDALKGLSFDFSRVSQVMPHDRRPRMRIGSM